MPHPAATDTPHLSVCVLVYDEVDSVEPLHRELMGVLESLGTSFEVLYVDDGSRDGSTERLGLLATRDARVRVVSFRRNFGQTAAAQAGIDHSRGDVVVFMDGDMQNDPHDIPHLLQKIDEGYDVVSGWRVDRRGAPLRVWPSRLTSWVTAGLTGVPVSDFGCALKAYRRDVIEGLGLRGEMRRLMPVYAGMLGARITEVPVSDRPRTYGRSKYSAARTSRVVVDLLGARLLGSRSAQPVYSLAFAGLVSWALAVVAAVVVAIQRLVPPHVHVHANLLVVVAVGLVVVGLQLLIAAFSLRPPQASYAVREVIEKPVPRHRN
jgi:Glycosyl transferase family 2